MQICSSWALLLANIDIAKELLLDHNVLTNVPLQIRARVFSWNAVIFTYCVIEKGIVLLLLAVFMLIQSVSLSSVFHTTLFHLFSCEDLTIHFTLVCLSSLYDIF